MRRLALPVVAALAAGFLLGRAGDRPEPHQADPRRLVLTRPGTQGTERLVVTRVVENGVGRAVADAGGPHPPGAVLRIDFDTGVTLFAAPE